jgi:protein-L-isoaspartate O-methyltransferase
MWTMSTRRAALLCATALLLLASCRSKPSEPHFPSAHRDVAPIVGDTYSTEDARDRLGEAEQVMQLAGVKAGMSVADVGAGQGYYTVRLARVVGRTGRVLAEDIVPQVRDSLGERVERERLDNVAVKLGTPDDPMLPVQSFDRVFLVHMYHEVASPYAFLWHLREGVKPDGLVILVDADRPVKRHGIPPEQAKCEFAALHMKPVKFSVLTGGEAYFMAFRLSGPRPAPDQIVPCNS